MKQIYIFPAVSRVIMAKTSMKKHQAVQGWQSAKYVNNVHATFIHCAITTCSY